MAALAAKVHHATAEFRQQITLSAKYFSSLSCFGRFVTHYCLYIVSRSRLLLLPPKHCISLSHLAVLFAVFFAHVKTRIQAEYERKSSGRSHTPKSTFSTSNSLSVLTAIFPGGPGSATRSPTGTRMSPFWILLQLRTIEVVVTTGAILRAKLQSNRHHIGIVYFCIRLY